MKYIIQEEIERHKEIIDDLFVSLADEINKASKMCVNTLHSNNKILFCGNGGSAADAQHLAAELSGRYKVERKGLPGISITADTSVLTSIGNDYGFDRIFDRQVEALAVEGDLLVGLSTSGKSINVINAFRKAKSLGCATIGLSGMKGGGFTEACDVNVVVNSDDVARIQEVHILIGHIMCKIIDEAFKC